MSRPIRTKQGLVAGALATTGVLAVAMAVPALAATDGAPATVVRKSVQVLADPSGSVQASRLYTQVQSTGEGDVEFTDTVDGEPRNLNGWGSPASVSGDTATWNFTVSGLDNQRTIADFPSGDLPISVTATARLDGQSIDLADLVGKSGELEVTYVVKNITGVDQEVSWTGGDGSRQSKTMSIPLPFVGSMDTELPSSYADIEAPGASVGGTGRNSTQLSYTLIMFEPLGALEQTITYKAQVTNASVPDVSFTFLPTAPADNPSTASAQEQYKGGQETGAELTAGATTIDTNLLKLAAGAGTLNEGLAQLLDGANQISAGLNETAVPGAEQLADGSAQVAAGSAELASGLNGTAAPGAEQLAAGSEQVADGLVSLQKGLSSLPDTVYASADFKKLIAGFDTVIAGLGQLSAGLTQAKGGVDQVNTGLTQAKGGVDQSKGGVDQVKAGLDAALAPAGGIAQLDAGVAGAKATVGCQSDPVCVGTLNAVQGGLGTLRTDTTTASAGLGQVSAGLGQVSTGLTQAKGGLDQVSAGLATAIASVGSANTPGNTLTYGVVQLKAGVYQLVEGIADSLSGSSDLSKLVAGGAQVAAGNEELASGLEEAASGSTELADGAQQVADGNEELASGLTDAADGATQIADGLDQAVPGGTQIEDGANQLSEEGTSQLIQAGLDTTNSFGEKYAVMEALNVRAAEGDGLPNGPAEGQDVSTTGVYSYTLQGVNQEDTTNLLRFVIAALLLGAAVGVGVAFARN
jgi:putative membrane protein